METQKFGARLRQLRKHAGMTQRQLANKVGIDFTYLSKLENGVTPPPSNKIILELAEALNTDKDELIILAGRIPSDITQLLTKRKTLRLLRSVQRGQKVLGASNEKRRSLQMSGKGLFKKYGSLSKIAVAAFLVVAVAASLWLVSPTKALEISFPTLPASGTVSSTYTFSTKVNITDTEHLPIQNINLYIYNVADRATYEATCANLPTNSNSRDYTNAETGGGAVSVSATASAGWTSGYSYDFGYAIWQSTAYHFFPPGGYGYGYGYGGGPTSIEYTIRWSVPALWPSGNSRAEIQLTANGTTFTQTSNAFAITGGGGGGGGGEPTPEGPTVAEIEGMTAQDAADTLAGMDPGDAAAIMEQLPIIELTAIVQDMSEASLTQTLPGLSPDTLHSLDPQVLFDALPNVPTEQLTGEGPPQPPGGAAPPVTVYVTPSGARYLTVQTWTNEWVVVFATPPPLDKLLIKTTQALTDVETTVEVFDEQPPEGVPELPADQIVRAYFTITFENVTPADIELGHITFKVENEWLEQNSINKWAVFLNRYDPVREEWIALPTKEVKEDDSYLYYTAIITHFSTFAISGCPELPPTRCQVQNLVINPIEAKIGKAIIISADVTNPLSTSTTYVATLWIDNTIEAGQNVYLEGGETKAVSFTMTRDATGSYQVRLDRLFGSFSVTEEAKPPAPLPARAAFTASSLTIQPAEIDIGGSTTISVLITNTGDLSGSYEVVLKIDNVALDIKDVTLDGGASKKATFTTSKDVAGTYTVSIDDLSATFTAKAAVAPPVAPAKPVNWWLIGGIIGGAIVIGVVIWSVRRRRA